MGCNSVAYSMGHKRLNTWACSACQQQWTFTAPGKRLSCVLARCAATCWFQSSVQRCAHYTFPRWTALVACACECQSPLCRPARCSSYALPRGSVASRAPLCVHMRVCMCACAPTCAHMRVRLYVFMCACFDVRIFLFCCEQKPHVADSEVSDDSRRAELDLRFPVGTVPNFQSARVDFHCTRQVLVMCACTVCRDLLVSELRAALCPLHLPTLDSFGCMRVRVPVSTLPAR